MEAGHVMGAKGGVQICEEGYVWRKVKKQKTDLGNRLGVQASRIGYDVCLLDDRPICGWVEDKVLAIDRKRKGANPGANTPKGRRKDCRIP